MTSRLGFGPVFVHEWRAASRRWQPYALRSLAVAALLVGMVLLWRIDSIRSNSATFFAQAELGRRLFATIMGIQLTLALLAAPAATAGAICLDKARGTLAHLLMTDLSDAEIVLGKLAARLAPVLMLVGSVLPLMAFCTWFGGVDPEGLIGAFLVTVGATVLGCTLALALSVWGRKTHEVLLASYLLILIWVGGAFLLNGLCWSVGLGRLPDWVALASPYRIALAPALEPMAGVGLPAQAGYAAATLLVSAALAAVATRAVRPVAVRQIDRPVRVRRPPRAGARMWPGRWRLPGPELDPNPVLWREWHRNRPSGWSRVVWATFGVGAGLFGLYGVAGALSGSGLRADTAAVIVGMETALGLLLLSVGASTSLAEERVRGSLDVLLSTPLGTSAIVWGKWWGTFRRSLPLAVVPLVIGLALGTRNGRWIGVPLVVMITLAYAAALTSLGLLLATWCPRPGRAVALTVAVYVIVSAVVIPIGMSFFGGQVLLGAGIASASPFWGTGYTSACIGGTNGPAEHRYPQFLFVAGWVLAYSLVAAGLLWATVRTFDRRLGRIPERAGPEGDGATTAAELVAVTGPS